MQPKQPTTRHNSVRMPPADVASFYILTTQTHDIPHSCGFNAHSYGVYHVSGKQYMPGLSSIVVRKFLRDDHGDLHYTSHFTILAPWGLIYHLSQTLLADGVGVALACVKHVADYTARTLGMASEQIGADEITVFPVQFTGGRGHI